MILKSTYFDWIEYEDLDEGDYKYLESLIKLMLQAFSQILENKFLTPNVVSIFNDEKSECPMLITNRYRDKLAIRLNVESISKWNQVVYQLSHELTHYFIRQSKENKDIYIYWLEETICEAFSLYILEFFAQNWKMCELYAIDSTYDLKIRNYLSNEFGKNKCDKSILKKIRTREELMILEEKCTKDRSDRVYERNGLYSIIRKKPKQAKYLLDYTKYISKDCRLVVDYKKWIIDVGSYDVLNFMNAMQPHV